MSRLKTPDLVKRNEQIFSQRDQIQMPMDEVPIVEVASQQQTLAVAEGPLQERDNVVYDWKTKGNHCRT